MPTYQYRCKDCNTDLEIVQKFTDDTLTECPNCVGGTLRKVFNAVGVVFKGSGFYRTDSRSGNDSAPAGSSGNGDSAKTESAGSDSQNSSTQGSSAKKDSAKQPATAGSSTASSSSD